MRIPLLSLLSFATAVFGQGHVTDYAPQPNVPCPNEPLLRVFTPVTQSLHPQESAYIQARESTVLPAAWETWIGDGSAIGYNLSSFAGKFPRVGLALSGGGMRASQYVAGVLSGLDARNSSAKAAGTGGLLQVSSYLAGLSGGSWTTGSLYMNNWPTIPDLIYGNGNDLSGWLLDISVVVPDGLDVFDANNQAFYGSIIWSIEAKANKSFDTSVTDLWTRMISYHFLNGTTRANFFTNDTAHGAGQLWSQLTQTPLYQQFAVPFPILYTNSRPVNSNDTRSLSIDSIVYEFSPLEFGSWDPNLSAMASMMYAGTPLLNGQPPNSTACVTGFDQVGFLIGTSSSLFNELLDNIVNRFSPFSTSDLKALAYALAWQFREVRSRANDVANWPNPFNGIKNATFQDSDSAWLELIDGSANQENMPLTALLVNIRAVDVVVAMDASSDDDNLWVNGTSLLISSQRISTILESSHQAFPPMPDSPEGFIATGVRFRPTFFGCDPQQNPPEFPLIINLPNSPPIDGSNPVTNTLTSKLTYTPLHTRIFLDQAHNTTINGFTPFTNTPDSNWGRCLQCAALDRARYKLVPIPARSTFCSQCFKQYCYDPQNPPSNSEIVGRKLVFVDPDPIGFDQLSNFFQYSKFKLIGGLVGLIALIVLLIVGLWWWKKRNGDRLDYETGYGGLPSFIAFLRHRLWRHKRKSRWREYKKVFDIHEEDEPWAPVVDDASSSHELSEHHANASS